MNKLFVLEQIVGLVWAQNEWIAENESKFWLLYYSGAPKWAGSWWSCHHIAALDNTVAATKLGNGDVVKPRVAGQKQQ